MNRGASLGLLLLAFAAAGCATTPVSSVDAFARTSANNSFEFFDRSVKTENTLVLPVEHDRQTEGASCGAHALASVINYWSGPGTAGGTLIYTATPPADMRNGYTIAEIMTLARANGLLVSGVRLDREHIVRELEAGRPVLVPVRLPSIYVQNRTMPGANAPAVGIASRAFITRLGQMSELMHVAMVNHYLLIVGYDQDEKYVVVEPVMGYRTISFDRMERYRAPFGDAAIVFSAAEGRRPASAAQATPQLANPG